MRLVGYLDKGASLGPDAPCLTMDGVTRSYADVQRITHRVARALNLAGVVPGRHVAVLSANDPTAFACVLAISRAAAIWCPINPRNEAAENAYILDAFDCTALFFQASFGPLIEAMLPSLPKLQLLVCLDAELPFARHLDTWLADISDAPTDFAPVGPLAMIPGTGGTTGKPKGVMLSDGNIEAMTAATLIAFPFDGRPVYLAMAPLTHAAGVLCFPVLALGGEIVIMAKPDLGDFLALIPRHRVTHSFLPPTLIYMLLDKPELDATDRSSLQCFWYGAAPMAPARLAEALQRIGPMGQFFGQTEAPMVITALSPREHFDAEGAVATARLTSAGRATPLVELATVSPDGEMLPRGATGEIVARGSLVMMGYYNDPEATAAADAGGWHRTGDIGFVDPDGYLFIVDRAKDMIITGGFNVYSVEVEQALATHPAVQDSAVIGLPDPKWGERVVAVVELRPGTLAEPQELIAAAKAILGSVKAPKEVHVWDALPRSKIGKVMKRDVKAALLATG